jgi:rubrerythrin
VNESVPITAYPAGQEQDMSTRVSELQRLPDGTPYFGQLAELAYDPDEDRVQCHLCGEWFRLLGSSHLRRTHGWTLAEYREAFHLPVKVATCSHDLSMQHSAYATSQIERSSGFGESAGVPVALRPPVRVPSWRSLAAYPDLASELHPKRNPTVEDPSAIAAKSSRKLWWRCKQCGHEWEATAAARAAGCVLSAIASVSADPEPSLASDHFRLSTLACLPSGTRPATASLDPAKISPGSKQKVSWCCAACGHQWRAAVHNRTARRSYCPACGLKRRARTQSEVEPARSLAVKHPDVAAELHPQRNPGIDPTRLGARSSLKLWWQCASCGHEWKTAVSTRTDGSGCPACYRAKRRRA